MRGLDAIDASSFVGRWSCGSCVTMLDLNVDCGE